MRSIHLGRTVGFTLLGTAFRIKFTPKSTLKHSRSERGWSRSPSRLSVHGWRTTRIVEQSFALLSTNSTLLGLLAWTDRGVIRRSPVETDAWPAECVRHLGKMTRRRRPRISPSYVSIITCELQKGCGTAGPQGTSGCHVLLLVS